MAKQFSLHSAEAYHEPHQTSKIEFFFENSQQFSLVNYFYEKLHFIYRQGS